MLRAFQARGPEKLTVMQSKRACVAGNLSQTMPVEYALLAACACALCEVLNDNVPCTGAAVQGAGSDPGGPSEGPAAAAGRHPQPSQGTWPLR
jgi:hypothetical protein